MITILQSTITYKGKKYYKLTRESNYSKVKELKNQA